MQRALYLKLEAILITFDQGKSGNALALCSGSFLMTCCSLRGPAHVPCVRGPHTYQALDKETKLRDFVDRSCPRA